MRKHRTFCLPAVAPGLMGPHPNGCQSRNTLRKQRLSQNETTTANSLSVYCRPLVDVVGFAADVSFWPIADMTTGVTHVRFWRAGSIGRRNTGVKSLCGGFKLQG